MSFAGCVVVIDHEVRAASLGPLLILLRWNGEGTLKRRHSFVLVVVQLHILEGSLVFLPGLGGFGRIFQRASKRNSGACDVPRAVIDDAKRELNFHAIALFGYLENFVNASKVA